jgi:hypothetical protein
MGTAFWIRRFLLVFGIAFSAIVSAHILRGHELVFSLTESAVWAMISAYVFVIARIYQSRRGNHCSLCNDIPETQES